VASASRAYAHLSEVDVDSASDGGTSDQRKQEDGAGSKDAAYIRRTIKFQRALDIASRW